MGVHSEEPLCTPLCSQRLEHLAQQFGGPGGPSAWADCFAGLVKDSGTLSNAPEQGTQKKRKSSQISLDSGGEETEQQSKRSKVDTGGNDCLDPAEKEEISEKLDSIVPSEGTAENMQPVPDSESLEALPQHIKVADHLICSVYN